MSKCYTFIYKLKELFVIFKIKVTGGRAKPVSATVFKMAAQHGDFHKLVPTPKFIRTYQFFGRCNYTLINVH